MESGIGPYSISLPTLVLSLSRGREVLCTNHQFSPFTNGVRYPAIFLGIAHWPVPLINGMRLTNGLLHNSLVDTNSNASHTLIDNGIESLLYNKGCIKKNQLIYTLI
jgi:hypothetical protein